VQIFEGILFYQLYVSTTERKNLKSTRKYYFRIQREKDIATTKITTADGHFTEHFVDLMYEKFC